jgi:hypothetical protein
MLSEVLAEDALIFSDFFKPHFMLKWSCIEALQNLHLWTPFPA